MVKETKKSETRCKGYAIEGSNCIFNLSGDGSQAEGITERCICCDTAALKNPDNMEKFVELIEFFKRTHKHAHWVLCTRLNSYATKNVMF